MLKKTLIVTGIVLLVFSAWLLIRAQHEAIPLPASAIKKNRTLNPASENLSTTEKSKLPNPTFDQIFGDHTWTATLSAERTVRLLATGDVLTARTVNTKSNNLNDFTWAWQKTAEVLKSADLTYINLETPLISSCPLKDSGFLFCGDVRHIQGLQFAGVDVINLANNHMGNYGIEGVIETVNSLETAGFKTVGIVDQPLTITTVKGTTFAFLGYNGVDIQEGVKPSESELIQAEVEEAQRQADIVIVQFHWGNEYTYQPSSHQQFIARKAIDAGADMVLGNHPHWWQPIEFYNNKPIVYSHGNFIFDQMWSTQTREGIVGKYTFYDSNLVDIEFVPIRIEEFGQPRWLMGKEKEDVLNTLRDESVKYNKAQ